MMKSFDYIRRSIITGAMMLVLSALASSVMSEGSHEMGVSGNRLALLPLINLSGNMTATTAILPVIYEQLSRRGINFVDPDSLRSILRKNRIRSTGMIDRAGTEIIKRELGLTTLIIGSIDYFNSRSRPEVGLSLRLMSLEDCSILNAVSLSATGSDFMRIFGAGQIDSIGQLSEIVVERILDRLFDPNPIIDKGMPSRAKVLIIPFDNISKNRFAGAIVSNQLIAALTEQGFEVVEPGLANDIFLKARKQPSGGVGLPLLARLREREQIQIVITGMVDQFQPARGFFDNAEPALELSARLLEASNGQILYMYNDERKGRDSESFFRHGKCNALGELVNKSLKILVNQIQKKEDSFGIYIEK